MPDTAQGQLPYAPQSETSLEAAKRADRFVWQQGLRVLHFLQGAGACGATQKEIAHALAIGRPSVCARVRALETHGRVWKTTARRGHCAVYLAVGR